jgi:hypothetical protein
LLLQTLLLLLLLLLLPRCCWCGMQQERARKMCYASTQHAARSERAAGRVRIARARARRRRSHISQHSNTLHTVIHMNTTRSSRLISDGYRAQNWHNQTDSPENLVQPPLPKRFNKHIQGAVRLA